MKIFTHSFLKNINSAKIFGGIFLMLCSISFTTKADVITIEPLFEYPVAPEEIESLVDKSNWLMQHFWDNMDFKSKAAVDQTALNDAFRVYAFPMQWAEKTEVDKSVDGMLKLLEKNPTLLLQFTKAAEEALYGQRAKVWIDEVYMKYLQSYLKNKKIGAARKKRYERQYKLLSNSLLGTTPSSFTFTTPVGNPGKFEPIGVYTIIEFGDPDCDDCRHAKLKMETDIKFSSLVERGLVNVMFIIPDPSEGWQTQLTGYPSNWVVGGSDDVSDILDIRTSPSFWVIGKDGKIKAKNVSVEQAMNLAMQENAN